MDFGIYGAAFAFVGLFRILPDFGMSYASTLAISRDPSAAGRLVGPLLGFQAVLSVLTLLLCLGIGAALFEGTTWTAVVVLSIDLLLKAAKSTVRWLLKAHQWFGTEAVSLAVERLTIVALGLFALARGGGVIAFVLVFAAVRILDTAALYAYVHARLVRLTPAVDRPLWLELFRKGLPFAYAGAMITLFFQVDAVMLERMRGPEEVGWYRPPVLVLEGLTLIPRILGYALIPTMAALFAHSPASVTALYRRGSKYLLLAGLPIGIFGLVHAEPFVLALFGAAYGPSVIGARILLPAATLMFLSNFGETTLACINRWGTIVVVSTGCLVLNVILNAIWIPQYGYPAAAWATLATEGAYFLATAAALSAFGHRIGWWRVLLRPIGPLAAFTAVLYTASWWGVPAASVAASLTYGLATFVFRVWDEKEITLLRGLVRGSKPDARELTA